MSKLQLQKRKERAEIAGGGGGGRFSRSSLYSTTALPLQLAIRFPHEASKMGVKRKISDVQAFGERAPVSPVYSDWERDRRFGIVVDAGSSGSRLQVYSWIDHAVARQQRQQRGDGVAVLPKIDKGVEHGEAWTMKVEPGELQGCKCHTWLAIVRIVLRCRPSI